VLAPSSSIPVPSQTRAIVLLAVAGFASQAMVRSADSLLPQIAGDFGVTVGAASIVVSAYTVVHGSMQLVSGPVGGRVGKYRMIAIATALCAVLVFSCGPPVFFMVGILLPALGLWFAGRLGHRKPT
jgi:MFS transporter, YNFM family, putative membrane transport protein